MLQTLIINDLGCYKGATIWLFCSTCSTLASHPPRPLMATAAWKPESGDTGRISIPPKTAKTPQVLRCFRWNGFALRKGERPFKPDDRSDRWSKIARKVILIDRGPENRQHGNKPHFTRVSLPFSAGNTAATGGNMLLLFLSRHSEATADRLSPTLKLKFSHLIRERQKHGGKSIRFDW